MKISTDSIQNRFSAYLVTAVTNKRIRYMEQRKKKKDMEVTSDLLEKSYMDFDQQFHEYIGNQTEFVLEDWERFPDFLSMTENKQLPNAINRLKDREKTLLFARIFGDLTFEELGQQVGLKPKQAEMAYFYVLRKLRKELGNKQNEF